ncbi:MAG: hypothetical protein DI586_06015 [Micavibrio aeruginosavorus]|uniref:Outer membrane protein beta-barrel domain-containing protein n=1 Tax=Micavibrio aeruginosavorus TaxID=349221 RepID=A0A2W5FL55_9BACT|nr:MAG: hypothetical protein DI586_06015 [Micavibrio aeruginosavorus]
MKKTWKKWMMAAAALLGGGTIANTANAEEMSQPLAGHAVDAGSNFTASPVQNKYFIGNATENSYSNFNLQSLPDSIKISAPASKTSFSGNDAPLAKPKPLKMSAATPGAKTNPAFSLPLLDEAIKSPENAEHILSVTSNNDMKPAPLKIAAASPEPAGLKLSGNYTADTVFDSYPISDRTKIENLSTAVAKPLPMKNYSTEIQGASLNIPANADMPPNQEYAPLQSKTEKKSTGFKLPPLRLTFATPVAVHHFSEYHAPKGWAMRGSPHKWNQGILNNKGLIAEIDMPVAKISPSTDFRVGVTAGTYNNSFYKQSHFVGLDFNIEKKIANKFAISAGAAVGAVSGYGDKIRPAMTPIAGVSYDVTDKISIGARAQWMPVNTMASLFKLPGKHSDTVIGLATLSFKL